MVIARHLLYHTGPVPSTFCTLTHLTLTAIQWEKAVVLLLYRWVCWGPERYTYLPKVTLPVVLHWKQAPELQSTCLLTKCYVVHSSRPQTQWMSDMNYWNRRGGEAGSCSHQGPACLPPHSSSCPTPLWFFLKYSTEDMLIDFRGGRRVKKGERKTSMWDRNIHARLGWNPQPLGIPDESPTNCVTPVRTQSLIFLSQ